jgi:hypothetical protein
MTGVTNVIQKTTEVISTPKAGIGGSAFWLAIWAGHVWSWLGENIFIVGGLVSVVLGIVSICNQVDMMIRRKRADKKG